MRYVEARIDDYNREEAYRIYVSKSLQLIPQNKCLQKSYLEILEDSTKKQDVRSGDEIVADVIRKAGLKFEE